MAEDSERLLAAVPDVEVSDAARTALAAQVDAGVRRVLGDLAEGLRAEAGHRRRRRAQLRHRIRVLAEELIAITVTVAGAGETGAGGEAIGDVLGVTRSAVRKRWPDAVAGARGPRRAAFTTSGSEFWSDPDQNGDQ